MASTPTGADEQRTTGRFYARTGKRVLDFLASALFVVAFSPLLAVMAVIILLALGSPILFRQTRPGRGGVPFVLRKFRTMTDARDRDGNLLPDAERLTRVGRFLRASSLDELPELWNVLRGDMSLVGPRPLLMEYLERYSPVHARRHEVRPGITGWAQVSGRQLLKFSQRLDLDVFYVDHVSFIFDLRILLLTIARVLASSGYKSGQELSDVDDLGLNSSTRELVRESERRAATTGPETMNVSPRTETHIDG